jgi:hypothetical protein
MAGLGRKEWSPGDTLNAADVNGYLMDQSVMVFAGTAARASAIPTPSAGMVAYSTATNLEYYDGSSWEAVSLPSGLVFITSGSITLQSILSFDNCFSATYANYLIMLTHTAGNNPAIRLRAAGADITAANYDLQGFFITGGAQTLINQNSLTSWTIANGTGYSQPVITLGNPFAATNTAISSNFQRTDASIIQAIGGRYNATTSADGFSVIGTNITVTARVYGYLNS